MGTSKSSGTIQPSAMGRPRDSGRDLAIFDATLSLLAEVGYDRTAMTDGLVHHATELAPGAAALFAEVAPAVITHRVVVVGEPCDAAFIAHLVDDVLLPLLRRT